MRKKQDPPEGGTPNEKSHIFALPADSKFSRTIAAGALFSFAFILVLLPWTIRNARVFYLFQPLAPSHGEMPGEFVPRGYQLWLRTWVDDERYIGPFLWSLGDQPIDIDDVQASAFDSAAEKDRVAALLDKYNHPPGSKTPNADQARSQSQPSPSPTPPPPPTVTPWKSRTSRHCPAPAADRQETQTPSRRQMPMPAQPQKITAMRAIRMTTAVTRETKAIMATRNKRIKQWNTVR